MPGRGTKTDGTPRTGLSAFCLHIFHLDSIPVQAFQQPGTGGADRDDGPPGFHCLLEASDHFTLNEGCFFVHEVAADGVRFYGAKSAGADVQGDEQLLDAFFFEGLEYLFGEVEAGSGSSH